MIPFSKLVVPQFAMDLDNLDSIDVKHSMSNSYCLLLTAIVTNSSMLSALAEFASRVVNKDKRIGLVLELGQNIKLNHVNSTRLPYIIAGQLKEGNEQFLCPTVGSNAATLQSSMCDPNFLDIGGKTVRVTLAGGCPNTFKNEAGKWDGADLKFLDLVQSKLAFQAQIMAFSTPKQAFGLVAKLKIILFLLVNIFAFPGSRENWRDSCGKMWVLLSSIRIC